MVVCRELGLVLPEADLFEWQSMVTKISSAEKETNIAIVGKYVQFHDAYLSIIESLNHAGFETGVKINIQWIDSQEFTQNKFADINGIIIPGGFGERGIEGKISACRFARENNIPFLGICLGMQVAVIEFARNVCGLKNAASGEFEDSEHRVIDLMRGQEGKLGSGGTMRLGAYPCVITQASLLHSLYEKTEISERHRHRFELNNDYREILTSHGLLISGTSPDGKIVEAIELPNKRFFIGVQFRPEFKSRPNKPHPLFRGLVAEASK
jgi:CTP synthase